MVLRDIPKLIVGELCQPSLGNFEVFPVVHDIQQPVFQFVWVLSHHPVQVNEVAVGIVEHLTDGALLVEKNGAAAPEHFHIDHVLVAGWEPLDDRGEQGLFPADPWNDRLDKSPPSFVYVFLLHGHARGFLLLGHHPEVVFSD